MLDRIYINEHGCAYRVDVMDADDGKVTYIIYKKTFESKVNEIFSISCITFKTIEEAYNHAINTIKNDVKG